jgi:hypothetical protein
MQGHSKVRMQSRPWETHTATGSADFIKAELPYHHAAHCTVILGFSFTAVWSKAADAA